MATMTVSEAYYVVFDILATELANGADGHRHHAVSALKGYDIIQICTAFKLLVANEFLLYANRDVFEESVGEEKFTKSLEWYECGPLHVVGPTFVADEQVDVVDAKPAIEFDDARFLSQETASSFAEYCRSVGADDPLYWQKVYSRLGVEYTANSPRGNDTQPPECDLYDSGIRDHFQSIVSAFSDTISSNPCYIGDCSDLPYPKKTILYAIRWLMDHHERRLEGADATDRAAIEPYLKSLSWLLTHVARDWHQIEQADEDAVARLNKCASFPDWALPLKAQYINEEAASNEAIDVAVEVLEDTVACEKRRRISDGRTGDETRSISDQFEGRPNGEREAKPESTPSAGRGPVVKFILFLATLATVVCGLGGAVWLGLLGQWRMVFVGFVGFVSCAGMPHVWLFATSLVLGPLAVVLHKHTSFSRPIAAIWTLFSVLCEGALVVCWTALVFWYFLSDAEKGAFAPALVWAYSITMAPLTYKVLRYPGLAFGGVWSLGLATSAYLLFVVFRIASVGGGGGVAVWLAAIVLLWSFLLAGYLMSVSVDKR